MNAPANPSVRVVRSAEVGPVDRGQGVTSYPITDQGIASQLLVGMTVIPVGGAIPWHTHDHEECVVILEGAAMLETRSGREALQPFDASVTPANTEHRYANAGAQPLRILWIYPELDTHRVLVDGRVLGHLDRYGTT
jgi:quercetin dioxygenase-like cupin family protein